MTTPSRRVRLVGSLMRRVSDLSSPENYAMWSHYCDLLFKYELLVRKERP